MLRYAKSGCCFTLVCPCSLFPCFCGMSCGFLGFFLPLCCTGKLNKKGQVEELVQLVFTAWFLRLWAPVANNLPFEASGRVEKNPWNKCSVFGWCRGNAKGEQGYDGCFCHKAVSGNWCLECSSSPIKCAKPETQGLSISAHLSEWLVRNQPLLAPSCSFPNPKSFFSLLFL